MGIQKDARIETLQEQNFPCLLLLISGHMGGIFVEESCWLIDFCANKPRGGGFCLEQCRGHPLGGRETKEPE